MSTSQKNQGRWVVVILGCLWVFLASISITACGGGGSSGGGITAGSGFTEGISLVSISFPKSVDLTKTWPKPPQSAPLSQQIVFTFSGAIKGALPSSGILISAKPGLSYNGPLVLYDASKNIIKAEGIFEVFSNIVVFTPKLPTQPINLSLNASIEEVPGLLPETTYSIFLPVDTLGAISNLKSIQPDVQNPTKFTTGNALQTQLYFQNFELKVPVVTDTSPVNGQADFPVNTLTVMTGDDPFEGIEIGFDQPLLPETGNLFGTDGDGDGFIEPNLFLRYSDKRLFAAADIYKGIFRLHREHPEETSDDTIRETQINGQGIGITDITLDHAGRMTGLFGGVLYDVDYRSGDPAIPLTQMIVTQYTELKGLAVSPDGFHYSVDLDTGDLIRIDADPKVLEVITVGSITSGDTAKDLAFRHDGTLFLMRVEGQGTATPLSYLETLDIETASTISKISNLPGGFSSMTFIDRRTLCLIEEDSKTLWTLNVDTADLVEVGQVSGLLVGTADVAALMYDMETSPSILLSTKSESRLSINPKGMLPFATEVEIMVRNRLQNIRGWSLSKEDDHAMPLASRFAASFTTFDPGPDPMEDEFKEDFGDNVYESLAAELGQAAAIWNFQELDGQPPVFKNLVATFGLGGSGELGDFMPLGVFDVIILDTDYQPLPLFDGSTPGVTKPVVVLDGWFNFRDIVIPEGITVIARGSNPLVLTATGDVEVSGTIDVAGLNGTDEAAFDSGFIPLPGGLGGPSAGRGGMGQPPMPPDFKSVAKLQSPPTGEDGWGIANVHQNGGRGGDTGARIDVKFKGTPVHKKSRGAGGGGGSLLLPGLHGVRGKGDFVPDLLGDPVAKNPPEGGKGGDPIFTDMDVDNNFFGTFGELKELHGGQGGGGGGSRWDSLNPKAQGQQPAGMPVCLFDSKGGGGGGGGGAVAIHALGEIRIASTGRILAYGGNGSGGEQLGASNFGGGGGGGGGGAVILHSGKAIVLEENSDPQITGAIVDVSGGRFGDGREDESQVIDGPGNPCPINKPPPQYYCILNKGDGAQGGFGLIQLMVEDPDNNISPPPSDIYDACLDNRIKIGATIFDPDWDDLSSKGNPFFKRVFLTYESDPLAYPKTFIFYDPFDLTPKDLVMPNPPLVDPHHTVATIAPISYGLSKWIDMGGAIVRPLVGKDPAIPAPAFLGFRGTDSSTGVVITENGYVKDYHIPDWNDIEVDAPDLGLGNFIPEDNEVAVEFQGAHAAAPGLSVPGDDKMSDWTPDITTLSGYQFIRFRVKLDVAKSKKLSLTSPRPQVNKIRIRVKY